MEPEPQPAWYADPTGRHEHRYWDGARWTDSVSDGGAASIDPLDGPSPATTASTAASAPVADPTVVVPPAGDPTLAAAPPAGDPTIAEPSPVADPTTVAATPATDLGAVPPITAAPEATAPDAGPAPSGRPPTRAIGGATIFAVLLVSLALILVVMLLTSL